MTVQFMLTVMLAAIVLYAWAAFRSSPVIGVMSMLAAAAGLYFVWVPSHATRLAEWAGIGRGVDLIIYTWVVISLMLFLNLHLKIRAQVELITGLARALALRDSARPSPDAAGKAQLQLTDSDGPASGRA